MATKTESDTRLHIGVGVDTARYGHYVAFMNEEKEMVSPDLVVMESADGYGKFKNRLLKLFKKFPNVLFHIHIDAAGQYATNLETPSPASSRK